MRFIAKRTKYSQPRPNNTLGVTLGCGSTDPKFNQDVISGKEFIRYSHATTSRNPKTIPNVDNRIERANSATSKTLSLSFTAVD